jgi:UDP-glucose 4-epimerase
MKIVVTGGAGFIGSNLAEALVADGHDVVVYDNFSLGTEENIASVKKDITVVKGDLLDAGLLKKTTKGADFIFNQAAASSSPMFINDLKKAFAVNVEGFINVLNCAKDNGAKRVIYASTSSVYGNIAPAREDMKIEPPNFYAASKLANEHLAKIFFTQYGLESIGFRYASVYGPHERPKGIYANLVSQFLWSMQRAEQPIIYGDGTQTRDFVYVKDVVQANMLAMKAKKTGAEVFNVGTSKTNNLNELVSIINKILSKSIRPRYVENKVKNYIAVQQLDITKITKIGYRQRYTGRRNTGHD